MEPILKVQHLEKYYGKGSVITKALDDVSFQVEEGEFLGIMGASGSGKSTLLNCVSTIDTPTGGKIILNGRDVTRISDREIAKFRRTNLGFVFQEFNLLDTLTVGENIGLSLAINHIDRDKVAHRVRRISEILGIEDIIDKFPYEISGGQRQRCACARALINSPSLIMADEPTGALDSHSSMLLLDTLVKMNERYRATILLVTHDIFSASFCSRVLFLRDGKIFTEIVRGNKDRKTFYNEIIDIMAVLGGETNAI